MKVKRTIAGVMLSAITKVLRYRILCRSALLFFILLPSSTYAQYISGLSTACVTDELPYALDPEPDAYRYGPGTVLSTPEPPDWEIVSGNASISPDNFYSVVVGFTGSGTVELRVNYIVDYPETSRTVSYVGRIFVTVNALPSPSISGDGTACAGSSGHVYTTEAGMSSYSWNVSSGGTITSGQNTNSIMVTWNNAGNQQVKLQVTNSNNCSAQVSKPVTVNSLPTAAITDGPQTSCVGSMVTYTAQSGSGSFNWDISPSGAGTINAGQGGDIIAIIWNTPGTHTVSLSRTDNSCVSASPATRNVTVNARPVPTFIEGPTSVSCGSTGNVYATQTGMTNYIWNVSPGGTVTSGGGTSDNSVTVTWNTTGSRSVSIMYTDGNSCTTASPVVRNVTVTNVTAHIVPSGPTSFCIGGSVTLHAFFEEGYTFQWLKDGAAISGQTGAQLVASTAGVYSVTATRGSCSETSNPVNVVTSTQPVSVITPAGTTTFCQGESVVLNGTAQTNCLYQWRTAAGNIPGATSVNYTATQTGVYTLVTTLNGCSAVSAGVSVTVKPGPQVSVVASGPLSFCEGDSVKLLAIAEEGSTYQWKKGAVVQNSTSESFIAFEENVYKVVATKNSCSTESSEITVITKDIPNPVTAISGPSTMPAGDRFVYSVTGSPGNSDDLYLWNTPAGTNIIYQNEQRTSANMGFNILGEKTVSVTAMKDGCESVPFEKTIQVIEAVSTIPSEIPAYLKVTPDRQRQHPPICRVIALDTLEQDELNAVYETCLDGDYYVGFELYYDLLADQNTIPDWTALVDVTLYRKQTNAPYDSTIQWTRSLKVDMGTQTFISTIFHDTLTTCDSDSSYRFKIKTKSTNFNGIQAPEQNIYLKVLLFKHQTDTFDVDENLELDYHLVNGLAESNWTYEGKAVDAYDLEWVLIEDHEGFSGTAEQAFKFKEPVRVTTAGNSYKHHAHYPKGRLWFRARAVGHHPQYAGHSIPGVWFYGPGTPLVVNNPQADKNWQLQTVFAEEGKYKKIVSYFDGTLRQRQVQTNLSTDENILVGETLYDFAGRKSVDILPAPSTGTSLAYKQGLNAFQSIDPEVTTRTSAPGKRKFHYDNRDLVNSVISQTTGAGKYFSENNTISSPLKNYIPDADGYVYSQTEYLNDGTGRISRQSGVGETFRMDGTHTTRNFYAEASRIELVRLFGPNVGNASHYKKNVVLDANGQVSVSYIDQAGKVVATALAGTPPVNVDSLTSYKQLPAGNMTVDLASKNVKRDGISQTVHKFLNEAAQTAYTFNYNLSGIGADLAGFGCQACVYDLTFSITDPDGKVIPESVRQQANLTTAIHCTPGSLSTIQIPLNLVAIGEYTITKTLRARELSFHKLDSIAREKSTTQLTAIEDSYVVDNASCDICEVEVGCDPEPGTDLIDEAISEIADLDCQNLLQGIIQRLKRANASDPEYEPSETEIRADGQYCQYELCVKNMISDIFEKQMARVTTWTAALQKQYDKIDDIDNTPDPFFANEELSGYGSKENMRTKLGNFNVKGTPFTGTLRNVTNPDEVAYKVDANGVQNSSGYHVLYYDLMSKRSQIGETAYLASLDTMRWIMFRNLYLEIKRNVKLGISAYTGCPAAMAELQRMDQMPQAVMEDPATAAPGVKTGENIVLETQDAGNEYKATKSIRLRPGFKFTGTATPAPGKKFKGNIFKGIDYNTAAIETWGKANGIEVPVSEEELSTHIMALSMKCNAIFTPAQVTDITNNLRTYFNARPKNFLRLVFQPDVDTNPNLMAIETILNGYSCSLDSVAALDPISCADSVSFSFNPNLVKNPTLQGCVAPGGSEVYAQIVDGCADGWKPAWGTPQVRNGDRAIYLDAASCLSQDAVMATLVKPLLPGKTYRIRFRYQFNAAQGVQAYSYLTLSGEQNYNLTGTMSCANQPDVTNKDYVKFPDTVDPVDRLYSRASLEPFAFLADPWILRDYEFIPTEASQYLFIQHGISQGTGSSSFAIREIEITELLPRTFQTCMAYDLNNPTLKDLRYNIDWAEEVQKCIDRAEEEKTQLIEYAKNKFLETQATLLNEAYKTSCLNSASEQLTYTYAPKEYHYTLYYYDQAGNLVQTVPPEGVKPLSNTDAASATPPQPPHTLITRYQYDAINQLIAQTTPDAGKSEFFYDQKGQLRLSRNAQQTLDHKYSYTRYDRQGRVIEVGEMASADEPATLAPKVENASFPTNAYPLTDVTRTHYDVNNEDVIPRLLQQHLRARVSWVEVNNGNSVEKSVTSYSYDIHGNVRSLVQEIPGLEPKRTDYVYDLVSGKVNYVFYQFGQPDQFIHQYTYDPDNRIKTAATSSDAYRWNKEAAYQYYAHGPLARTELGDYRVQGQDYYYTLQGWIKGVNMPFAGDPGADGLGASKVGRDVYAYTLGYFKNDYKASNAAVVLSDSRDQLWPRYNALRDSPDGLYNGNIAWMTTDLVKIGQVNNDRKKGMQAMLYHYDQLHRIVKSQSLTAYVEGIGFASRTASAAAYDEKYAYDANGNIATLDRRAANGSLADDFDYTYYANTNKLRKVKATDADYVYDVIGNLVTDNVQDVNITWTPYGKVRQVKSEGNTVTVSFLYDAAGNRVSKLTVKPDTTYVTRYVRDASGNVMAVYADTAMIEQPVYGSSRLGQYKGGVKEGHQTLGRRHYELSNHLGNVLSVITDNVGMSADSIWAAVVSTRDYYSFGLEMSARTWNDTIAAYRYAFNGKELDESGYYNFGARMYDSRIGLFLSIDPLWKDYAGNSPYIFAGDNPLRFIDINGEGPGDPIKGKDIAKKFADGKTGIKYRMTVYADQPGEGGDRDPYEGIPLTKSFDPGHAFIRLERFNDDNTVTEAVFGFYPVKRDDINVWSYDVKVPGTLRDDNGGEFEVNIIYIIDKKRFEDILNTVASYDEKQYSVDTRNCTDFVLDCTKAAKINLETKKGTWGGMTIMKRGIPSRTTNNAGDFGEDMKLVPTSNKNSGRAKTRDFQEYTVEENFLGIRKNVPVSDN